MEHKQAAVLGISEGHEVFIYNYMPTKTELPGQTLRGVSSQTAPALERGHARFGSVPVVRSPAVGSEVGPSFA